jgi:hypothetical protein
MFPNLLAIRARRKTFMSKVIICDSASFAGAYAGPLSSSKSKRTGDQANYSDFKEAAVDRVATSPNR